MFEVLLRVAQLISLIHSALFSDRITMATCLRAAGEHSNGNCRNHEIEMDRERNKLEYCHLATYVFTSQLLAVCVYVSM